MRLCKRRHGRLAIIGGRLEPDNTAVFESLKPLCNGRIAVIPVASEIPHEVGAEAVDSFLGNGIKAELVPLFGSDWRSAFNINVVEMINAYGSVFFTGGDQSRIIDCLITNGQDTPALQAIRKLYATGGLVAGSSAGAAMMSTHMILGGTSGEALTFGRVEARNTAGLALGHGLGFFPWGVIDQHFIVRGRVGRLAVAIKKAGVSYGFGIDENTAFIVDGLRAHVRGETGVVVLNLNNATTAADNSIENIAASFLDDGDDYDLQRNKVIVNQDKKRIRTTKSSFQNPAPIKRCAFGSYTVHDLMLRLANADPSHYRRDNANSWPEKEEVEWCVEIERRPRRSRALFAIRKGKTRYTLINFYLHIRPSAKPNISRIRTPINTHHRYQPPQSRLVMLGNNPLQWDARYIEALKPYLVEPVGVMATASAHPRTIALEYIDWLRKLNIKAMELYVHEGNIERRNKDTGFLRSIGRLGSVLVAGGNQRRLTQTLTHRGELTEVLQSLYDAFESDTNIIAIGAAAAAFGPRMITAGDSCSALRFGASDDAGSVGMVMEPGLGLFEAGIVDQNFLLRGRLGRLLVACAEEHVRYGFGICEESGLVMTGDSSVFSAIGHRGFVVVAMHNADFSLLNNTFDVSGVELLLVPPGAGFDVKKGSSGAGQAQAADSVLEDMVAQLADSCDGMLKNKNGSDRNAWLNLGFSRGPPARLNIHSKRARL